MDLTKVEFSKEHIPVLLHEIIEGFAIFLDRKDSSKDLTYFDGTFGRGGHYRALKHVFPHMKSTVMDQDVQAIEYAQTQFQTQVQSGELKIIHANFSQFSEQKLNSFDMMLLDLGVSSPQLDQAERGFSFYNDGPLDMRMNQQQELTAEGLVNTASEEELIHIFKEYGEVHRPFRVVRALVNDRKIQAFQTTKQLASLIERVDGWQRKGFHPATQYFMALRLAVNSELEVIKQTVLPMMESLNDGGRLAIISFHSLEDRIIKNLFRDHKEIGFPVQRKVIVPTQEECDRNPRSRSAKLRIFQKGAQDEQRKYKST